MKKFIHISECYKRDSIMKHGLIPAKPVLFNHIENFRKDGALKQDEDKVLYTWMSCYQDNKFIKDAVYYRAWIRPRNIIAVTTGQTYSFINHKTNLYKYDQMIFDVYEISNMNLLHQEFEGKMYPYYTMHVQRDNGSRTNTLHNMDTRYEHEDKLMGFSKTPEKDLRIIKQAKMTINKNGRIDVKII